MANEDTMQYYRAREQQERLWPSRAVAPEIAKFHTQLADEYAVRARHVEVPTIEAGRS